MQWCRWFCLFEVKVVLFWPIFPEISFETPSQTQYVKCDNLGAVIDWSVTTCGAGLFCNIQMTTPIAVNPCLRVAQSLASCATAPTTTPFDTQGFCSTRRVARYSYSTGCTQYIYCFLNAGRKSAIYKCPGVTLFDDTLGACVNDTAFVCPT